MDQVVTLKGLYKLYGQAASSYGQMKKVSRYFEKKLAMCLSDSFSGTLRTHS